MTGTPETPEPAAEQQVSELGEGKEVDEKGDDEGLHILGGQLDGVGEHAHASVELQHVDELERRQEDDDGHDEAVHLVPDANCHEVDIFACHTQHHTTFVVAIVIIYEQK